jgi:protein gp37
MEIFLDRLWQRAMADTSIEWTDVTWNPVAGCSVISPGCTNCYAMRMAARLEAMGVKKYAGLTRRSGCRFVWNGNIRLDRGSLDIPTSWRSPKMIFVNSMSDLFHDGVPDEYISEVWAVMQQTPRHTYQILTKRPDRMLRVTETLPNLPNVWLGTSVENEDYLCRLDDLRKVTATIRFVSFEPLLSSVGKPDLNGIHWAIVGGESGPNARPIKQTWVKSIRSACRRSDTAFFFKQWGGPNKSKTGRTLDGRVWNEYPRLPAP